jgi:hypothetical protein
VLRQAAAPLALALAGAVVAVVSGGSTAGTATALALVGLAAVLALSLVFFAVGKSEDEERAAGTPRRPEPPRTDGAPRAHVDGDGNGAASEARRRRRPLPPRRPD